MVIEALRKHGMRCTFGVIPFACARDCHSNDPQELVPLSKKASALAYAVEEGVLEVAQHGYSHQTVRSKLAGAQRGCTEFYGVDYDSQLEKLSKGQTHLEETLGTKVSTFIPPWNSYDCNTLRALESLGFRCISAGYDGADESTSLKFLPYTAVISHLRNAVRAARNLSDTECIIVVQMHAFDFAEIDTKRSQTTYGGFEEILSWLAAQTDVEVRSISQVVDSFDDLGRERLGKYKSYRTSIDLLPSITLFRDNLSANIRVYQSSQGLTYGETMVWTGLSVFYLALFLIAFVVAFSGTRFPFRWPRSLVRVLGYSALVLLVLGVGYALCDLAIHRRGLIYTTLLSGVCAGIWVSLARPKIKGCLEAIDGRSKSS
jgi:peptidoglycan/xylan/chitin deacetylase (PgdA/CDA1 family)